MHKEDKERLVSELTERLKSSQTLIVADYRGLTNAEIDALRGKLLEEGARFSVVKNTLTRRAAEAAGADALLALLEGPTAIAFLESGGDPAAVAKALADTARTTRVLAIKGGLLEGRPMSAEEDDALAKLPPADVVGSADLAKQIEEGFTDFDVAIATPDQMGTVGRLGRILGPRGLMPNPKTGTVTMDVAKAVSDAKAGKLEYRTDRGANVHVAIGKKSFDERQLTENYAALVDEIVRAKPSASKGRYIRQITLTSTMGPGIHVDPARTRGIVEELEESAQPVSA